MLPLVTMTTRRGREGGAVDFVFDIPVFIKSPRRRHENNPKKRKTLLSPSETNIFPIFGGKKELRFLGKGITRRNEEKKCNVIQFPPRMKRFLFLEWGYHTQEGIMTAELAPGVSILEIQDEL